MKHLPFTLMLMLLILLLNNMARGQSFLGPDGGFEGAAVIDNANTYTVPQFDKWTKTAASITMAKENVLVRSGAGSLKITMSSTTGRRIYTPEFAITASTSKWYVQYYRMSADTSHTQEQKAGNLRDGVEAMSNNYSFSSIPNSWEKVTYAPTSAAEADTVAGLIMTRAKGAGGDVYIDDFCIYASATVDNIVPDDPISPSASPTKNSGELMVAWTEATGGTDGGGYMAVRRIGSASTTAPNINGIYAVGNKINASEEVVYIGTAANFTDAGLDPSSTYYYTIYTYDKAYNYSAGAQTTGTIALPSEIETLNIMSPRKPGLVQNYPNPFNPATTIEFIAPVDAYMTLKVFNMLGRQITTLWHGTSRAGYHIKVTFEGSGLSSGIYYYVLEYGGKRCVKSMLLLK
jgi:trimeric autotransporter adhesin